MNNFTLTNSVMTAPMVSGYGQFHTNEADPKKPEKTLTPYVTVTWPEIITMAENPPEVDKAQGQWFIPSTLLSRTHDEQKERGLYFVLPFDFDNNIMPLLVVKNAVQDIVGECDLVAYNSRSANDMQMKCRVLIPLAVGMSYQDYRAALHIINDDLDAAGFITDRALERAGQVVYLPNRGEVYDHIVQQDGILFEPSAGMAQRVAQYVSQVHAQAEDRAQRRANAMAKRANITWGKYDRPIDAFNASYTVEEILDRAGYDNDGRTNYRHPESESGGFSASVENGRVYSLSPDDKLYTADTSNGAHDAFSAFCVLFHAGDQSAAIKDACDNWLMVNGESWNKLNQREFMQQKDQSQAIESFDDLDDDDLDDVVKSDAIVFPEPYQGPMACAVNACLGSSYKPQPALTTLAVLVAMASICGNDFKLPDGLRFNLYGTGILETGRGKDEARAFAEMLAYEAGVVVTGKPASGEGLEDLIQENEGRSIIMAIDEIAHMVQAVESARVSPHLITLSANLLRLFSVSKGSWHTRARAGKSSVTIKNPTVSLLGFATPEKLGEAFSEKSIVDGLAGRLLFVAGDNEVSPNFEATESRIPESFTQAMCEVRHATASRALDPVDLTPNAAPRELAIVVSMDEAARALVREWTMYFETSSLNAESPMARALFPRSAEKMKRIAGVLAVWDNPSAPVMTTAHIEWASAVVDASNRTLLRFASEHMHGGVVQGHAAKVLGVIKKILKGELKEPRASQGQMREKGWAPHAWVLKVSKLDAKEFAEAIEYLRQTDAIRRESITHRQGRDPAICYRIVGRK